jgi:Immunity protein 50
MNWNDFTLNPKAILGYFDAPPDLKNVEIFRVTLSRDASTMEIVFEPRTFPERTSKKWPAGANAVQITLRLSEVSSLVLNGWANNVLGDLSVIKEGKNLAVTFVGTTIFEAVCASLEVTNICAYRDTREAHTSDSRRRISPTLGL